MVTFGLKCTANEVFTRRQYCISVITLVIIPPKIPNTEQDLLMAIIQLISSIQHRASEMYEEERRQKGRWKGRKGIFVRRAVPLS